MGFWILFRHPQKNGRGENVILIIAVIMAVLVLYGENRYFQGHWKKGLSVSLHFCQKGVNAGERCLLEETICNEKRMPLPSLQVKFKTSAAFLFEQDGNASVTDYYYRTDLFAAGGRRWIIRTLEFTPSRRGFYELDSFDVLAKDFLYTTTCSERRENKTCLYVYPYKRDVSRFDILYRRMQGEQLARRTLEEDPFAFRGMREYRPTDSMRRINWKSTAKSGKLLVNMYESSYDQEICILLDGRCRNEGHKREMQEMAISLASSVAADLLQKGIPVSLCSNMTDVLTGKQIDCPAGNTRQHLNLVDRQLALADAENLMGSLEALWKKLEEHGSSRKCYLIITPEETQELYCLAEEKKTQGEAVYGIVLCREGEAGQPKDGFMYWEV